MSVCGVELSDKFSEGTSMTWALGHNLQPLLVLHVFPQGSQGDINNKSTEVGDRDGKQPEMLMQQ